MYGTQAGDYRTTSTHGFENDVNMYGTQADIILSRLVSMFENDVNMYGTQAFNKCLVD